MCHKKIKEVGARKRQSEYALFERIIETSLETVKMLKYLKYETIIALRVQREKADIYNIIEPFIAI